MVTVDTGGESGDDAVMMMMMMVKMYSHCLEDKF